MKLAVACLAVVALATVPIAAGRATDVHPSLVALRPDGSNLTVVRADCPDWTIGARGASLSRSRRVLITLCGDLGSHQIDMSAAPFRSFKPVVTDVAGIDQPTLSPDGRKIAYGSAIGGVVETKIVDVKGKWLRTLLGTYAASWAPDGRRLVAEQEPRIVVIDEHGHTRSIGFGGAPVWQPHGSWIAWEGRGGELVMARADGSGYHIPQPTGLGHYLAWSPGGRFLAYGPTRGKGAFGLGILDVRTWHKTRIGFAVDGVPAWSPDGNQIAFVGTLQRGDREHLIIAAHDGWGWGPHYVADFDGNSSSLMWTRDNRLLIISCLPLSRFGCNQ